VLKCSSRASCGKSSLGGLQLYYRLPSLLILAKVLLLRGFYMLLPKYD
jgi:hypothetical protein